MMTHDEIATWFGQILPVYYIYPPKPIFETVPCITYKLSESGPMNRRQLAVTLDLWTPLATYLEYGNKVNEAIEKLPRKSSGALWSDFYDPAITLSDGTMGLAHRAYQFTLN